MKKRNTRWTEQDHEYLRKHYPDTSNHDIADALGRTISSVQQCANKLNLRKSDSYQQSPASGRLMPGHATWNKGKPGSTGTHPNSRRTQFKKGEMTGAAQHNYMPIGSTRITRDGQLERKVTDDPSLYHARRWVSVARLVWESEHGPVPPKHVVRFKPGMQTTVEDEITLERIECISQAENMRRNSIHRYPKEIALAVQLRGALNRRIRNVEKHQSST